MCDEQTMSQYYAYYDMEYDAPADFTSLGPVWRCRDGRVIPIKDMTTDHLKSTIRMLRRNVDQYRVEELKRMSAYISQAPDGAADACEMEAAAVMEMLTDDYLYRRFPVFADLMQEAQGRGL